jgi:hypothetical protein
MLLAAASTFMSWVIQLMSMLDRVSLLSKDFGIKAALTGS